MNIVILPGLDGTRALSSEVETKLSAKHKVLALSYPPEMSRYDDIETWLTHALPTEDYILVAQSFSGPLALRLSAARPRKLKGVVFVASFAKSPRKVPAFLAHALRLLPVRTHPMAWMAQPLLMGKWANAAFTHQFRKALSDVPTPTLAARLQDVLRLGASQKSTTLKVPSVYLQATHDRLVPPRMAQAFNHGAHAIIRIDGPHFLLQANPEDTAMHILEFTSNLT